MKQLLKLTFLLLALLLPATAMAHDFEVNGIYYNINGNEATVTYRGSSYYQYSDEYSGNITVPSTVIYNGMTYSVTSIGVSAFCGCSGLTSITIPNSVTSIGNSAFSDCNSLSDVFSSITNPLLISMGSEVFKLDGCHYSYRLLHVPVGSIAVYQADANWRQYFGAIVDNDSVSIDDLKFEVDNIIYTIVSDTTVKVSGPSVWDVEGYGPYVEEGEVDLVRNFLDFIIPNHVTYNSKDYTVTEIGDWAFYYTGTEYDYYYDDEGYLAINYNITVPETVTLIGVNAFGGTVGMVNVICQAKTPP